TKYYNRLGKQERVDFWLGQYSLLLDHDDTSEKIDKKVSSIGNFKWFSLEKGANDSLELDDEVTIVSSTKKRRSQHSGPEVKDNNSEINLFKRVKITGSIEALQLTGTTQVIKVSCSPEERK